MHQNSLDSKKFPLGMPIKTSNGEERESRVWLIYLKCYLESIIILIEAVILIDFSQDTSISY